ncbi:MAG: hypothetical protein ACK559_00135, partial [bacterium]
QVVVPRIDEADVAVAAVEEEAPAPGAVGARRHPVLAGAPVPVIRGVELQDHVVEEVLDVDPLADRRVVLPVCHHLGPGGPRAVDRAAGVDGLVVVLIAAEVGRHHAGVEALPHLVDSVVDAVQVQV